MVSSTRANWSMAEESRILVKASVEGRRMLITNWLNPMIMVVIIRERLCLQYRGEELICVAFKD